MWDEQIDEVARQMTDGTTEVNLRGRVLNRIEAGSETRPRWTWMGVSVTMVGGVAALLFLLVFTRPDRGSVGTQTSPAPPTRATTSAGVAANAQSSGPLQRRGELVIQPAPTARRAARRPLTFMGAANFTEEPLPAPDSIALTSLELPELAADEPITTEPIVIAVLELSPIDEPAIDDQ